MYLFKSAGNTYGVPNQLTALAVSGTMKQEINSKCISLCKFYITAIEVMFQSFKQRGFNIESTHLKDPVRFRKIFALVAMAFALAFNVGLLANQKKPIAIRNNGYKKIVSLGVVKTY